MEKLIIALLNDDHGISEEAYNALVEYVKSRPSFQDHAYQYNQKLLALLGRVDATDRRFYFSFD